MAQVYMCEPIDLIARDPNAPGEAGSELTRQIDAAPAAIQRLIKAVVSVILKTSGPQPARAFKAALNNSPSEKREDEPSYVDLMS